MKCVQVESMQGITLAARKSYTAVNYIIILHRLFYVGEGEPHWDAGKCGTVGIFSYFSVLKS